MYEKSASSQPDLPNFYMPFGGKLNPENRWIKLRLLVPWEEVEKLRRHCEIPAAIEVSSRYFASLGIDYLVIKNLDLPASERFVNGQAFVITAVSEVPPELKLKEDL